MSRSLSTTANFIFKLHTAALQATNQNIRLYPVMDGIYASSASQPDMLDYLRGVFEAVADEFNSTARPQYRFIVKGALAFGPVIDGINIPQQASPTLAGNPPYKDAILLGLPMVQAHVSEKLAPPFGLFIHESARTFTTGGQNPLPYVWWKWVNNNNQHVWNTLHGNLGTHFDWCAARALALEYTSDRIKVHKEMAAQYFSI